jgi:lipooligosaccharide transport system ATP-binding protein
MPLSQTDCVGCSGRTQIANVHTENPIIIQADHISKTYGNAKVVDNVSFTIRKGECCGLLGPNGAGKTTTLRMLLGHTQPTSGRLEVMGYRIPDEARTMRARIGVVAQADNLDLEFSVTENLRIYGRYHGLKSRALETRIQEVLGFTSLQDKAKARIYQLSGGMKRRLAIARALINEPELLVLDEPTTGLDPQIRQNIWLLLQRLQKSGMTLIITTHYMEEASRLCERIILMDHGRILADQSPGSLVNEQMEPYVLEVYGERLSDWRAQMNENDLRNEPVGESWFYFGDNLQDLTNSLDGFIGVRYTHRPSNLEDVFLRLTGHGLRDA